jgi:peptide deformylase
MPTPTCKRGIVSLFVQTSAILLTRAFQPSSISGGASDCAVVNNGDTRRKFVSLLIPTMASACTPLDLKAEEIRRDIKHSFHGIHDRKLRNYRSILLPNWHGTALPGPLTLSEACSQQLLDKSYPLLTMGKWPDPMLRHPASRVPTYVFQNEILCKQLQLVATALKNTARKEGAVGLAAQQCGVDASLIYIENVWDIERSNNALRGVYLGERLHSSRVFNQSFIQKNKQDQGIFLVNPRIIQRSPESDMIVWTETCLVMPPEFRATLLRDAEVTIEYESMDGITKHIKLRGELARCVQHEMDHDRGVLIVDHVSSDELLTIDGRAFMAEIENSDGLHYRRMQRAYSRAMSKSSLQTSLS